MKTKHYLFALLAQFFSMTVFAYDAEINGIYYNFNGTEATVTNGGENRYSGDIVIPQSVTDNDGNTYDVTSIGGNAFGYCECLTSITIPESVTSIENYAFQACSGLTAIVVEEGNTKYDSRNSCNAIIETSSNTLIIGCKNTTIPETVTSIGDYAFYQSLYLTSIIIPESVTCIGDYSFAFCHGLTNITIPKSVKSIGNRAFDACGGLKSIVVEEGNPVYDSRNGCNAIIETASNTLILGRPNTTIPESVTSIGNYAFWGSWSLTSITIPESVTSIGEGAFLNCNSLTSITIPESVKSIGNRAFDACGVLNSIAIPESVTSIGRSAFDGTPWFENQPDGMIYAGKIAYKYKGNMPENTAIEIKEGTIGIADAAFENSSGLTSIIIPEGVANIGDHTFANCDGLTSITIPESVTTISDYAFFNCTGLTSITIPNSVMSIGDNTFYGCSGLTFVSIPESVTKIGICTFSNCKGLTSITIPKSVTSIGNYAFDFCTGLTSINIPESVTSIGEHAFYGCTSLTSITIPKSVTTIGEEAFFCCNGLTSIKVDTKTPFEISSEAFAYSTWASATLYVPKGSKAAYKATDYWYYFREIIECNYVDVEDQIIVAGQSEMMEISVNTKPHTNLVGFQMDLTLPEGVTLDKTGCSLSSRITDEEQELTIGKLESGAYRLTSTSLSLTPISDNDGALLTLKLTAAKDCVDGNATISNVIFSTSDSQRVTMDDESFDITIYYTYKLSYLVDGEEYMADSVVYNTPLTPVAEPVKAGYTFLEWIGQPEVMPNHDVVVTGRFYLYGDVNTDEAVDVVDVVDIARFVVAMPSTNFREKLADLNYDNTVNIADAVTLVNHIAGDQNFVKAEKPICGSFDYAQCQLQLQSSGQKALSLSLAGGADFTAFQFEVDVPENTDITAMRINGLRKDGHQLLYNKVSENRYRVAALSLSNATFLGSEGELLNISIDGLATDDVCIHDIHFVKANGTDVTFDNLYLSGNVTKIADVDGTESDSIYDLQGRHRSTLQRGLNIVGNKTIIKK